MAKEKIKVYTYTRVSTAMQIDGYSLDAQKSRMKAFAEFNDYEIAHEYEDAGKSGKSMRPLSRRMYGRQHRSSWLLKPNGMNTSTREKTNALTCCPAS